MKTAPVEKKTGPEKKAAPETAVETKGTAAMNPDLLEKLTNMEAGETDAQSRLYKWQQETFGAPKE